MADLDGILRRYTVHDDDTKDRLLGGAFVAVNKDGVICSGAAGRIDFDRDAKAFAGDTFTWVASLTKLPTITCVMQLVEKGVVKLEDDIRQVVPELGKLQILKGFDGDQPILEDNTKPITLRMLLSHVSGLGYDTRDPDTIRWAKAIGRTGNHLAFNLSGFSTPFNWQYGSGVDWAGIALERLTGQTLGAYMQAHVFDPVGMKDSGFWPERLPDTEPRTAPGSLRQDDGTLAPFRMPLPKEHDLEGGGAGLHTTADDYARFLRAFLAGELLTEESMRTMFTPQLDERQRAGLERTAYDPARQSEYAPEFPTGLPISSGIGGLLNLEDVPGKRRKGSMMWTGACNSRWWVDRETGVAGVMIVNCFPWGEPVNGKLYDELERAVYKSIGQKA
ncbi:hypothetical protein ACCO45_010517 [Purpureocillium lilacinum]|uniref:Uncharacterized protein n=1 Tax=Purpureocillium lilacinum TaxID=33203 RepID=A0ACC4DGI0_PURLI